MKKISLMNYVIVAIIFIITIFAVFTLRRMYLEKKEESTLNQRLQSISKIKEDDLKSYLVENTEKVIYLSHAKELKTETFEETLNNYIREKDLSKEIVYLNLDEVSSNFYNTLKEKYFDSNLKNVNIIDQPNMLLVENGKITKVLYTNEKEISLSDIEEFLRVNEVID